MKMFDLSSVTFEFWSISASLYYSFIRSFIHSYLIFLGTSGGFRGGGGTPGPCPPFETLKKKKKLNVSEHLNVSGSPPPPPPPPLVTCATFDAGGAYLIICQWSDLYYSFIRSFIHSYLIFLGTSGGFRGGGTPGPCPPPLLKPKKKKKKKKNVSEHLNVSVPPPPPPPRLWLARLSTLVALRKKRGHEHEFLQIFLQFWITLKYIFRHILFIISTCYLKLFRKLPIPMGNIMWKLEDHSYSSKEAILLQSGHFDICKNSILCINKHARFSLYGVAQKECNDFDP